MINRGSEKISCEEVEDLVYRYDSFDLGRVDQEVPLLGGWVLNGDATGDL